MSTQLESEPTTRITPELRDSLNVWSTPVLSDPVERSDIRRWAIAVYWPDEPPRIFWDEDYARTTKYGGIIAPREFNPFTWRIHPLKATRPAKRKPGERVMNGGQTERYGVHIRPGDVISVKQAVVKLEEKTGKLGLTLYRYTEMLWTNQKGEFVRSRISTSIIY